MDIDLYMTQDGDLMLCKETLMPHVSCEIQEANNTTLLSQIITNRIKTMKPDWFYDHIGANLELLLGEDNTKQTSEMGIDLITNALCGDNFIKKDDVWINPVPIDPYTLIYMLAVRISEDEQLVFKIDIALSSGVNIEGV